nr:MAG TPA: hypothetical protein [Caudoviricetes sp.]
MDKEFYVSRRSVWSGVFIIGVVWVCSLIWLGSIIWRAL